ncbi:uncharacterized protein LOC128852117 [Cuculus canorus]|uniref:uncharacterized protein LOC128852117 n=1 Tax=Cuculus canorus TaxID=55661 RepID=UPI0023AA52D5|nr:uncharacterized protein LOC128852117 [Cuculus canorus]
MFLLQHNLSPTFYWNAFQLFFQASVLSDHLPIPSHTLLLLCLLSNETTDSDSLSCCSAWMKKWPWRDTICDSTGSALDFSSVSSYEVLDELWVKDGNTLAQGCSPHFGSGPSQPTLGMNRQQVRESDNVHSLLCCLLTALSHQTPRMPPCSNRPHGDFLKLLCSFPKWRCNWFLLFIQAPGHHCMFHNEFNISFFSVMHQSDTSHFLSPGGFF